jgi:hypothetical protein
MHTNDQTMVATTMMTVKIRERRKGTKLRKKVSGGAAVCV